MNENDIHNAFDDEPLIILGQGDYEKRYSPFSTDFPFDWIFLPFKWFTRLRWRWRCHRRRVKRSRAVVYVEEGV